MRRAGAAFTTLTSPEECEGPVRLPAFVSLRPGSSGCVLSRKVFLSPRGFHSHVEEENKGDVKGQDLRDGQSSVYSACARYQHSAM